MDYGEDGLKDTLNKFSNENLELVGAGNNLEDAKQHVSYQNVNGVKLQRSVLQTSTQRTLQPKEQRRSAAAQSENLYSNDCGSIEKADLVLVHVHWGQEYDNEPNDRQKDLAKAIADAGADVIIGAHPHVLEPIEVYNGTVIFYSLGNFVFDQGWSRTRTARLYNTI